MSVNIGSSKVGIYLGERPLSGDSDWELLWQYEGTTGTGWSKTEILSADLSKYKGLYLKVSAQGTSTNTNKQGAIYISLEDMRANGNTQMGIQFGIIAGNNWGYRSFAFSDNGVTCGANAEMIYVLGPSRFTQNNYCCPVAIWGVK